MSGVKVNIKMRTNSINQLDRNLRALMRTAVAAGELSLVAVGEEVMNRSYEEVPKATNALASSGFVKVTERSDDTVSVKVGYGGDNDHINPVTGQPASSYMIAVHEKLNAIHPNGKAKFLEDPINELRKEFQEQMAQGLRPALSKRGG